MAKYKFLKDIEITGSEIKSSGKVSLKKSFLKGDIIEATFIKAKELFSPAGNMWTKDRIQWIEGDFGYTVDIKDNVEETKDEKKSESTTKKTMSDTTIFLLLALAGIGFYWILSRPSK
jgi:hypothetical protein